MKRLQTFEFDLKFANLKANRRPTADEVARHEIELTESGLIRHDKDLGKLFGVTGPQLTHICSGADPIPARAAAAFLRLHGAEVPEAIDVDDPGHAAFVRLLLAPLEEFIVLLRAMGAEIPSVAPDPGVPWRRLLRLSEGANGSHRGYLRLHSIDRPQPMGLPPMRCMPLGEVNPVTHRDLPTVMVNERIAYTIGLPGFNPGEGNAVHLWAIHRAAGPDLGEPLYVPLLPAPWWREDRDGALSRKYSAAIEVPPKPGIDRCLVVPARWGPTIEVIILVTRRPMDEDILAACRQNYRLDQDTLDLAATRLMDPQHWRPADWMLLRMAFGVEMQGAAQEAAA